VEGEAAGVKDLHACVACGRDASGSSPDGMIAISEPGGPTHAYYCVGCWQRGFVAPTMFDEPGTAEIMSRARQRQDRIEAALA
jgi:hypothetical protein